MTDRYKGEIKGQLRHGKGTYIYDNKYFQYDGDWYEGAKHGHGKLTMLDGSYYEGSFVRGEIEGNGYRVFANGSTYTGQFYRGELHGQGIHQSIDGTIYEGAWIHNKREGHGILTYNDGTVYEGEFHNHKRHGEGMIFYHSGDKYEGGWVYDMRHGHGKLTCTDGTVYEGQWKGDLYHGEGTMVHSSGIVYQGLWINGYPEIETVRLVTEDSTCTQTSQIIIEQGKTFSITVKCINENGDIVYKDNGRKFKITALAEVSGLKKYKSSISVAHMLKESSVVSTPYGKCILYELLQVPQIVSTTNSSQEELPKSHSYAAEEYGTQNRNEDTVSILHAASFTPTTLTTYQKPKTDLSGPLTKSMLYLDKQIDNEEDQFLMSLTSTSIAKSCNGQVDFNDLFLPPPPPPKLSAILQPNEPTASSLTPNRSRINKSTSRTPSPTRKKLDTDLKKKASSPDYLKSSKSKKIQTSKTQSDKDSLMHSKRDKFCPPVTYVLVVSEVTDPPFMGTTLPPLYIHLQVLSKKTNKDIKAKTRQTLTPVTY